MYFKKILTSYSLNLKIAVERLLRNRPRTNGSKQV